MFEAPHSPLERVGGCVLPFCLQTVRILKAPCLMDHEPRNFHNFSAGRGANRRFRRIEQSCGTDDPTGESSARGFLPLPLRRIFIPARLPDARHNWENGRAQSLSPNTFSS